MGKKLQPDQLELYKKLDDLLFYEWDPIGISKEEDWPKDEYHSYLGRIFSLLIQGKGASVISSYLTEFSTSNMGLSEAKSHDLIIAKKAVELRNKCLN